jgi:hypothetical protein
MGRRTFLAWPIFMPPLRMSRRRGGTEHVRQYLKLPSALLAALSDVDVLRPDLTAP